MALAIFFNNVNIYFDKSKIFEYSNKFSNLKFSMFLRKKIKVTAFMFSSDKMLKFGFAL